MNIDFKYLYEKKRLRPNSKKGHINEKLLTKGKKYDNKRIDK